jgi:hypothetical protein
MICSLLLFLLAPNSSEGLFQVPLQSVRSDARLRPWQHNLRHSSSSSSSAASRHVSGSIEICQLRRL